MFILWVDMYEQYLQALYSQLRPKISYVEFCKILYHASSGLLVKLP
jgi:hypothetical protein